MSSSRARICDDDANDCTGKYLPALRCLLAIQKLLPDSPKCHELGCRLRLALDGLSEPLPKNVQSVIKDAFLSKQSSKSVHDVNEEYLSQRKDSAPHVQAVVRVRHALKPGSESVKDLLPTLASEETSLEQAVEGLKLLEEVGADVAARQEYCSKAQERWVEADVFKMG